MGRGTRTRIGEGLYRDKYGIEATVKVGNLQHGRRFSHDAEPRDMQRWRARERAKLLTEHPRKRTAKGTLASDVPIFLATLSGRTKRDYEFLLQHWMDSPYGSLPRATLTKLHVRTQLATWVGAGVPRSTVDKRLNALRRLCTTLDADDDDARDPTRGVKNLNKDQPEPRDIPRVLVEAILSHLPDCGQGIRFQRRSEVSKTKARLRVIAETGLPHMQVAQLRPEHIDWVAGALFVTARRKGRGARARTLPLTPGALDALRAFAAADAWGTFSRSSVRKSFARACRALQGALNAQARREGHDPITLPHWRPYDLKHSFATELLRHSRDQRAVQQALLHGDIRSTDRYTLTAIDENVKAAIDALGRARSVPAGASDLYPTAANYSQNKPTEASVLTGTFGRKSL